MRKSWFQVAALVGCAGCSGGSGGADHDGAVLNHGDGGTIVHGAVARLGCPAAGIGGEGRALIIGRLEKVVLALRVDKRAYRNRFLVLIPKGPANIDIGADVDGRQEAVFQRFHAGPTGSRSSFVLLTRA